jgi:hypothetical protein
LDFIVPDSKRNISPPSDSQLSELGRERVDSFIANDRRLYDFALAEFEARFSAMREAKRSGGRDA